MKYKKTIDLIYKPHNGQALVHESNARFKCIACGRRWGKTHSAFMELLVSSLRKRGRYRWIAPVDQELAPVFNILYEIMRENPDLVKKIRIGTKIYLYIELINGSKIWFHSADRSNSLREGFDGVVIDKAAYIKRETWQAEIRPTLKEKKGWAILISTPNGRNWFYELYLKGQDRETWPEYESWSFSSYQNTKQYGGFLDKEEIDAAASSLPVQIRRQEIYAEFLEGEGTFLR